MTVDQRRGKRRNRNRRWQMCCGRALLVGRGSKTTTAASVFCTILQSVINFESTKVVASVWPCGRHSCPGTPGDSESLTDHELTPSVPIAISSGIADRASNLSLGACEWTKACKRAPATMHAWFAAARTRAAKFCPQDLKMCTIHEGYLPAPLSSVRRRRRHIANKQPHVYTENRHVSRVCHQYRRTAHQDRAAHHDNIYKPAFLQHTQINWGQPSFPMLPMDHHANISPTSPRRFLTFLSTWSAGRFPSYAPRRSRLIRSASIP